MFRAEQPANAPARGVEVFSGGADGEGYVCDGGGEGADSSEGDVVEAVVDLAIEKGGSVGESDRRGGIGKDYFVGENDDVVFNAEVSDCLELILGKYFPYRVVTDYC